MADPKDKSTESKTPSSPLRRAMITTKTAQDMTRLLEDREIETVGRGPRQASDGTFIANVIAKKAVLDDLSADLGKIEIQPESKIPANEKKSASGNRYKEEGVIPRGLGRKE
ncbi:hypothetical protein [Thioclava indica]|uniref:Uncharacterized protein n=1 Tax=Thioclava indica TaxID=1353528 RepID=A0A074K036_9RHOB|nr:hypothetical protein [Thioclava indica]KEO61560.1 hypothetical protein DT23_00915 [Thioclava indica]